MLVSQDNSLLRPMSLEVLGKEPMTAYATLPARWEAAAVKALYIHVPFCASKCHYCDFYSLAGHLDQVDDYLKALEREISLQTAHFGKPRPETIFIGGGTPTLLTPAQLQRLLALISSGTDFSNLHEFTIEANPNTFCADRAAVLTAGGVNRISFGAQSFVKSELAVLQRDHDPENVARAIEYAMAAGIDNYNLDLIFGTPGQTLQSWDYSLSSAIALQPTHLSCYSLIYEPNTAMTARFNRGEFALLDEELELAIFQHTYDKLRNAGYGRYETSNYARPGRECRHNLHYWKGADFLAWGPAAAAGYHGHRWKNVQSLAHYLTALLGTSGQSVCPITQMEHLPPRARAAELTMLWLRLTEGLNFAEFERVTGIDARPLAQRLADQHAGLDLVEVTPDCLRITDRGVPVSDALIRAFHGLFD